MRITIAERLRPFSHQPGTCFILPGSNLSFQIFPSFIRVHDLSGQKLQSVYEIQLDIQGPVKDFTIQQDLEKAHINVWGHSQAGYFFYKLSAIQDEPSRFLATIEKKIPSFQVWPQEQVNKTSFVASYTTRLSMGMHKAQNLMHLRNRSDMAEIFPLWLRLGALTPVNRSSIEPEGTLALLSACEEAIFQGKRLEIVPSFRNVFLAGFSLGLCPRLQDEEHQGFCLPELVSNVSPLSLLTEGARLIKSLFIQTSALGISILPVLPPEFHAGRLINMETDFGLIHFEWSKKAIRRLILEAKVSQDVQLIFQKDISRFRLRSNSQDRGHVMLVGKNIALENGHTYFLDRFER
jgi:hypothetical protein